MAVTWTISDVNKRQIYMPVNEPGEKYFVCTATLTADGSATYTTNGDAADLDTAFDLATGYEDLSGFQFRFAGVANTPTAGAQPFYDYTNQLLMLFVGDSSADGTVEVANTTAVADFVTKVFVLIREPS